MPVLNLPSFHIDDDALHELPSVAFEIFQGVTDSETLSAVANEDLACRDFMYTLAIMCSPDDPAAAIALNDALVAVELYQTAQILEEIGLESSMDTATGLMIADREPPAEIILELMNRKWLAHLAVGHLLRRVISLHQSPETRDKASLREAATVFEAWCQSNQINGGKWQNVTRNFWPQYQSVSHLWAAMQIVSLAGVSQKSMPTYLAFLFGTAQWLLEQGVAIQPKGRRPGAPLLTLDNMWTIPLTSVPRTANGSIKYRIWNNDLNAHDIRTFGRPSQGK